jgi:hypothetical protein
MEFNATFNNISVIAWRSILLVEETGENHRHAASLLQTLSYTHSLKNKYYHSARKSKLCSITLTPWNYHIKVIYIIQVSKDIIIVSASPVFSGGYIDDSTISIIRRHPFP